MPSSEGWLHFGFGLHPVDGDTLRGFAGDVSGPDTTVHTDGAGGCKGMERERESVNHPASGYMREMAHVNGVEGFRAMPKRGCHGACHHISPRHPERHIRAYAGRTRSTSWRRSWRGPAASACCAAVPLKVEKWPGKRQRGQLEALPFLSRPRAAGQSEDRPACASGHMQ